MQVRKFKLYVNTFRVTNSSIPTKYANVQLQKIGSVCRKANTVSFYARKADVNTDFNQRKQKLKCHGSQKRLLEESNKNSNSITYRREGKKIDPI